LRTLQALRRLLHRLLNKALGRLRDKRLSLCCLSLLYPLLQLLLAVYGGAHTSS